MSAELEAKLATTTLGQWQARQIEKAANILAGFVESTPEDKLRWRPAIEGTSGFHTILEQIGECIFVNGRFCNIIRGEPIPTMPEDLDTFASAAEATTQLKESARAIAEIIRNMDTAALAKDYITHRGPLPGALIAQFPIRNMTYHMGQVNMIQLLYGDAEFHVDSEFTTL